MKEIAKIKGKMGIFIFIVFLLSFITAGCMQRDDSRDNEATSLNKNDSAGKKNDAIILTQEVQKLEPGLSAVKYEGSNGFDKFLAQGGAASDAEVADFLLRNLLTDGMEISIGEVPFGCSTISVKDGNENMLFGRNFDWNSCNAMIVYAVPETGYASISTVNTDFIGMTGLKLSELPDRIQALIALYAPLDGMNEKGFAVSVNMIQDSAGISQNTDKPDITTTTAIRLLLEQASDVEEALELLGRYDMHASMGYMMHLALADKNGHSAVVEYVNNEMIVTETPVVTNFYFAEGEKNGIGTAQSHERYDTLMQALSANESMGMEKVRDVLDSVSKDNFGEFESTEWSVVFNQGTGEVHYYHRENYKQRYIFNLR